MPIPCPASFGTRESRGLRGRRLGSAPTPPRLLPTPGGRVGSSTFLGRSVKYKIMFSNRLIDSRLFGPAHEAFEHFVRGLPVAVGVIAGFLAQPPGMSANATPSKSNIAISCRWSPSENGRTAWKTKPVGSSFTSRRAAASRSGRVIRSQRSSVRSTSLSPHRLFSQRWSTSLSRLVSLHQTLRFSADGEVPTTPRISSRGFRRRVPTCYSSYGCRNAVLPTWSSTPVTARPSPPTSS